MTTVASPVFASASSAYLDAGWPAVLPVPSDTKNPPPTGYTGYEGRDTPPELVAGWVANGYAHHSIALRMPDGVIGIDVDDYTKPSGKVKIGAQTLAKITEKWGPLPATWTSTARGEGPSRIALYRVPKGRYATVIQPDIEIIQWFHRYAVVWPSPHMDTGTTYTWYAPDGTPATRIPRPDELPELPSSWVSGLAEGASGPSLPSASHASGDALLAALSADARPACSVMYDALDAAARVLDDPSIGTRHDAMTQRTHRIVQSAAYGHPGLGVALPGLRDRWVQLTAGEDREGEFDRMLLSSARKAVTAIGGVQMLTDPCTSMGGPEWARLQGMQVDARPRPADNRVADEDGDDFEPLHLELPPTLVDPAWGQVIGTEPFDPGVELDHLLADAMLRRCIYMTRRAADAKNAWLQRGAEQWSLEGDLAGRIVAECATLMPEGDPRAVDTAVGPTPAQRAYKRRLRMMTNGPAAAVAATIKRQTDGGRHPATVRLTDLDADPEILWAGGWPFDLRASAETPTLSGTVDPYGPHLVAAGVAPADVPTPRFDAFLSAVWPDKAVRAWALRVLSIAFTGYPDAALPVLVGEGGTGKTSLITLLMEVLGSYAHAADHRLLGSGEGHASIVYALKGRRLSFIDEAMREGTRNTERLKQLTGGGELTGNAMNQNPITFKPTHTLVLTSNTPPNVGDPALRRRVRLIPCEGDPAEVRKTRQALIGVRWLAEAPGVLTRMMREAAGWLADPDTALGAAAPLTVQFAVGKLVEDQDVVGHWLAEVTDPHEHGTKASVLYTGFRAWARGMGVRDTSIPSLTAWGLALNERGIFKIERRDANYRPLIFRPDPGIGMYPGPPPPAPAATPFVSRAAPPFSPASRPIAGSVEGLVEGSGGLSPQPSALHNPRSSPVFAPLVDGVDTSSSSFTCKEEEERRGEREHSVDAIGKNPPPSTDDLDYPLSSQVGHPVEGTVHAPPNPPHPSAPSTPTVEGPTSSRSVTKAEAARRAAENRITKAEARRKIAEENRAAAIDAAAGEHIGLPAVATREGYVMPVTLEQAEAIVRKAVERASAALTVDVETSGYPVGHVHHRLRTVQLGDEEAAVVFDAGDPMQCDVVRTLLDEAPKLHAHSAAADLVPLAHAGLIDAGSGWARMFDTVIPAKLADPQSTGSDPGLKQLAGAVLGSAATAPGADEARVALFKAGGWSIGKQKFAAQLTTPPERSGWAQVPSERATMVRYAASDVLDTAALARRLPEIPPAIMERERVAEEMTARVAHRGLRIDADRLAELTAEHTGLQAEAARRVQAFGDIDNPGSGQQVAAKLQALGATLPVSDKGNASVAEHVLSLIKRVGADTPAGQLATAVLDYRHSTTVLGLFLAPYSALVEHGDGRARPTIYTLGTDTGRMSSVRPNAQQLPREGGVRSIYRADPGHVLISADFSGVELRGAAALSQDPAMIRLIADEDDFNLLILNRALAEQMSEKEARARILAERGWTNGGTLDGFHWVVARQTFGQDATKSDRYVAKRACFGTFYGGGSETLAQQAGVPVHEMEQTRGSLRAIAPGYFEWVEKLKAGVRRGSTQFPSYSGRIIHFPPGTPHKAPAYAISGSCRELLVDALVRWRDTRWGDATLLPVHDELVIQVPAEDADAALAELVACMEGELYGVKIVAEASEPSPFWQDSV